MLSQLLRSSLLLVFATASHLEIPITRVEHKELLKEQFKKGQLGDIAEVDIPFELKQGYRYMGPIYLGTPGVEANVTFDTGSPWLTVSSSLCSNCPSEVYHQGSSHTSIDSQADYQFTYPTIDQSLNVTAFTDTVCLNEDTCVTDFYFYAITSQSGMSAYSDGFLGFSPAESTSTGYDSYVQQLKNQGVINRGLVAIYLSEEQGLSNIQIGNYNDSYINGTESDIQWFDNAVGGLWVLRGYVVYDGFYPMGEGEFYFIIDSGNRKIGFPNGVWTEFFGILMAADDTIVCDDLTCYGQQFDCSAYTEPIKTAMNYISMFFDETEFIVLPSDIMFEQGLTYPCELAIYNSGDYGILGDMFMIDYYTIYDQDYGKIGLAPAAKLASPIPDPIPGPEPKPSPTPIPDHDDDDDDKKEEPNKEERDALAICMLTFVLAGVVCIALYIRRKRSQETIIYRTGPNALDDDDGAEEINPASQRLYYQNPQSVRSGSTSNYNLSQDTSVNYIEQ